MLSFFRRTANSLIGQIFMGLVFIAMVVTLYEGKSSLGFSGFTGSSDDLGKVGSVAITQTDVRHRADLMLDGARQQQPNMDMAGFAAAGGVDGAITQMMESAAIDQFGAEQGMRVSRRAVDGEIASNPAFRGVTGAYDRSTMLQFLSQRKMSEAEMRGLIANSAMASWLTAPAQLGVIAPTGLILPYAAQKMEVRQGQIGVVPSAAMAVAEPNAAQVEAFYRANTTRYTLPERRVVKYAIIENSRFTGKVAPTEDEIQRFYTASAASYAATPRRAFTQVIAPSEAVASAIGAKISGGASIADAAKAAGLSPIKVEAVDLKGFTGQSSANVAAAAFALANGATSGPLKSGLGYHIIHVDSFADKPGKSLAEARGEIVKSMTAQKVDEAMRSLASQLGDAANGGQTFDQIAQANGFHVTTTPAITAQGRAPDQPDYRGEPETGIIFRDAFQAAPGDAAAVSQIGAGKSFAFWHVDRIIAAAPRPLADIRQAVALDARNAEGVKAAKKVADAIFARVNAGTPIAQAFAGAGVKLPPLQPAGGQRIQIERAGERVPPPLKAMFAMHPHQIRVMPAPDDKGWFIVYLDKIVPPTGQLPPQLLQGAQQQISQVVAQEYADQFAAAAMRSVGTTRNTAAIAAFKASLAGGAAAR